MTFHSPLAQSCTEAVLDTASNLPSLIAASSESYFQVTHTAPPHNPSFDNVPFHVFTHTQPIGTSKQLMVLLDAKNDRPDPDRPNDCQPSFLVQALYDYQPEGTSFLSFRRGDFIEVQFDPGWWCGRIDGKRGMIPSNFVAPATNNEELTNSCSEKRQSSWTLLASEGDEHVPVPGVSDREDNGFVVFEPIRRFNGSPPRYSQYLRTIAQHSMTTPSIETAENVESPMSSSGTHGKPPFS
jgi:hypothetical protein